MTPLACLTLALFFEARGEPQDGLEAVANVIINRVEDKRYPNDVCGVVYESKAFSFTHDSLSDDPQDYQTYPDRVAYHKARKVAQEALQGHLLGISSTHYHTTNVLPYWSKEYSKDGQIGNHVFYTNETPYK